MSKSQNGWPVVEKSACDQGPFEGVTFPNGILKGDVATICRWQLRRYRALVEPLVNGTCWGWYAKNIEGSSTISNHASATAWDINADQHPMGPPTSSNMTQKEIDGCRQIVRESEGTLRWGGDYSSRPDPMHWEINDDANAVARFADKIREGNVPSGEGDMMLPAKGDSGEHVKFWQHTLNDLGYSPGTVDGHYGDNTEKAVNKHRADHDQGPLPYISGWHGFVILRDQAKKYAGKNGTNGTNGKDGAPGKDGKDGAPGKDGVLTGDLTVLGGNLQVETV